MKKGYYYISCGGTGGHFYPGLSIARELQNRNEKAALLLSGVNSAAQSLTARAWGIEAIVLPKMPSPGKNPLRWSLFLLGFAGGFLATFCRFVKQRPKSLFIMGSFASAPAAAAAFILRVPLYLHDGNARIGKANRILSRQAKLLCTAFPAVNADKCRCPVICTGMPLRQELEDKCRISKEEAIAELNSKYNCSLSPDVFTVLIFGGSQGAATLNKNIPAALKNICESSFQVIHLTGKGKLSETEELYKETPFQKLLLESSPRMELFLGSADLVFSRSGGSSAAELALFGKCAVLIPYPYAAEGHQEDNARHYVKSGAGEMISDKELTPAAAEETILRHLNNPELLKERSANALKAACPNAAAAFLEKAVQTDGK